ncbi:hypothetical protein M2323_004444 [Rhodoblastus acidophilus]|uniref:hypothetical protein n=1 Tax=Rhodoblastus acidophilus TaxID=1074 RepID=UPI0022243738|nr:hypothetical protein [Rhodoblastus acidophilus]MCW2286675.1 hypothetical protein [Rhodoblastus acidophilus]MCW2335495.1 hypothetical protein [Rhodoblastus acidophilus]
MKMIRSILDDPFVPIQWGANTKGMQAKGEIAEWKKPIAKFLWLAAMYFMIGVVLILHWLGLHKQVANRLLEPWMHITVLITSTQWSNFLALRDHPDAEPHIQVLAREIRKALDSAHVQILQPGDWHLPWITDAEAATYSLDQLKNLSVARNASTSYKTVDGYDMSIEKAQEIWTKMFTSPIHASPFEHVFQMDEGRKIDYPDDFYVVWAHPKKGGNLGEGVVQLRKTLPGECL